MKTQVLFIQGGGSGAHQEDAALVGSLRRELGTSYDVLYPQMPHEDSPDYQAWKLQIRKELEGLQGEIILIGHSVGGYILLKYLSKEKQPDTSIVGLCIIAAPYPSGDENWEFEGFALPKDFGAKLPANAEIFLYHSHDDQIVPFAHVLLYANALSKATVRETNGGHQLNNNLVMVAEDIKGL
ncbi:alpha/beta fold hydrolase [Aggregatilinea lenta]|uniref:alpha/beta fold hydrolase n=1 Tax=Aggregatilinea lenta TaxID=913108 RepID=UPI000E5B8480|nr:alpha/beta fold hydrolase [Aggregatilinea lenta]